MDGLQPKPIQPLARERFVRERVERLRWHASEEKDRRDEFFVQLIYELHSDAKSHGLAAEYDRESAAQVNQAFELTKFEEFAGYRQQLFDMIYDQSCHVFRKLGASWLKLLAKWAVEFQATAWYDKIFQKANKPLSMVGPEQCAAYDAIKILEPVHEASAKRIKGMPRPKDQMWLS